MKLIIQILVLAMVIGCGRDAEEIEWVDTEKSSVALTCQSDEYVLSCHDPIAFKSCLCYSKTDGWDIRNPITVDHVQ